MTGESINWREKEEEELREWMVRRKTAMRCCRCKRVVCGVCEWCGRDDEGNHWCGWKRVWGWMCRYSKIMDGRKESVGTSVCCCPLEEVVQKHRKEGEFLRVRSTGLTEGELRRPAKFPTERRVERRRLEESYGVPVEEIEKWAESVGITIGPVCPSEYLIDVKRLLWTYRDLGIDSLKDLPSTDLLKARVRLKKDALPYAVKGHRRLSPRQEGFYQNTIQEGIDCGLYERTPVYEEISPWSAPPVIMMKVPDDPNSELRLTFDYSHVEESMPGNPIVLASEVQEAMGQGESGALGKGDLKNGYWLIEMEEESRPILAF